MKSQQNNAAGKPQDWKKDFDEETIREAHTLLDSGKLEEFASGPTYCVAKFRYGRKKDDYDKALIQGLNQGRPSMRCTCGDAVSGKRCCHEAAALIKWEEENAGARKPREYSRPFQNEEGETPTFFDMQEMTKDLLFYHDIVDKARLDLADGRLEMGKVQADPGDGEDMTGSCEAVFSTEYTSGTVSAKFRRDRFDRIDCDLCNLHYVNSPDEKYLSRMMCEHATCMLLALDKELKKNDPGDETDWTAARFLRRYGELNQYYDFDGSLDPQACTVEPKIERTSDGHVNLTFSIGKDKLFVVKNLTSLVDAVRSGEEYQLGRNDRIIFSDNTFSGRNERYYRLIEKEVMNAQAVNDRLQAKSKYPIPDLTAHKEIALEGEALETFYDIAAGLTIEYSDKYKGTCKREKPAAQAAGNRSRSSLSRLDQDEISEAIQEAREEDLEDTGSSREGRSRRDHIVIGGGVPEFTVTVRKMHKPGFRRTSGDPSGMAPDFHGITVIFDSPVILSGTKSHFFLTDETLTKLEDSTYRVVAPFYEAGVKTASAGAGTGKGTNSDEAPAKGPGAYGHSEFAIGVNNISEFYYRIMPELLRNPYITVIEEDEEDISSNLPPEARFDFYLDTDKDELFCRPFVTYGDTSFDLTSGEPAVLPHGKAAGLDAEENGKKEDAGKKSERKKKKEAEAAEKAKHADDLRSADLPDIDSTDGSGSRQDLSKEMIINARRTMHDKRQEGRVRDAVKGFFPSIDLPNGKYATDKTDDNVYEILNDGVNTLLNYGDVHATEKFEKLKLRNCPQISVGVKMNSNLLDLQVHPQELSPKELLELLESYRKKKKYHLLNNGTFISLEHQDTLRFVDDLFQKLDVPLKDFVSGKMHLPVYRAYYLNHMLEEHEDVAADRDHGFRQLLQDFDSIADSDYDVPESLKDVLRPYQVYAYQWMRTLSSAHLGGILADDMGLGKTLETISVLLAEKERGTLDTALIVCPASLVFNWQMEFDKWAPEIKTVCVVGTPDEREMIVNSYRKYDVLITSYDLLKRDIDQYKEKEFSYQIVDEAQYIKNPGAAVSKSVKVISSKVRFALTGTPIENRLSELWSIFDYLMPGFLYTYNAFKEKFEMPVARMKDEEATSQLKKMVQPFILRRLKEEVLSDLPEKNEEIQYAVFEKKQRELYEAEVVQIRNLINNMGTSGGEKLEVLAELTRLRQICCDPSLVSDHWDGGSAKREVAIELIKTAIDGEHKVLLFSQFTSMLSLLEKDMQKEGITYYKIIGDTPKEERLQLARHFNDDDTPLFLISLKAGGTGLNLTGADVVIHYDPWWNLAAQNQATDRAHRIGQTRPVAVYKLIAAATIEEKIIRMQTAKKDLADAILSGTSESLASLTKDELMSLLG